MSLPEDGHLVLLQDKLNAYLRFRSKRAKHSKKCLITRGRSYRYKRGWEIPAKLQGSLFFEVAQAAIEDSGFRLQFRLFKLIGNVTRKQLVALSGATITSPLQACDLPHQGKPQPGAFR